MTVTSLGADPPPPRNPRPRPPPAQHAAVDGAQDTTKAAENITGLHTA
ncbi:hypothetical protein ACPF8X_01590 [Streptomyces sp. G35A]